MSVPVKWTKQLQERFAALPQDLRYDFSDKLQVYIDISIAMKYPSICEKSISDLLYEYERQCARYSENT